MACVELMHCDAYECKLILHGTSQVLEEDESGFLEAYHDKSSGVTIQWPKNGLSCFGHVAMNLECMWIF
jgi:hypothetical protein